MHFSQLPTPILVIFIGVILFVGISLVFFRSQSLQTNSSKVLGDSTSPFSSLSPADFEKIISDETVQIIDIRTPSETSQGKLPGAMVLDYYDADFSKSLAELDRSKTYYIYCNSGNRTRSTLAMMKQMGFETAFDLKGGIQAWISAGLGTCTKC
jgi:phage shock protein E